MVGIEMTDFVALSRYIPHANISRDATRIIMGLKR